MLIKYPNNRGKRVIQNCKECKIQFETLQSKVNAGREKFCTKDCYFKNRYSSIEERQYLNCIHQKTHKYGLSEIEYNNLFKLQDNKCKICSLEFNNKNKACVDHCHKTNMVRGLLCNNCNKALGFFKDDINNLKNAIMYLKG